MAKVCGRGRCTSSTGEATFLRVHPIVAFALAIGLQLLVGLGYTTWDLAGAGQATNVEAQNAPESSNSQSAVCIFRITKECATGANLLPQGVWFHDKDHGGPSATSRTECEARKESWKMMCAERGVDMLYDADWPKVPPPPEGSSRCEFQIARRDKERIDPGGCKNFPNFHHGWFLDSDKGGPDATTPEECQARKKGWEDSCEAVEMRFIGAGGDIVAVNLSGDLSRGIVERYLDNPWRVSPN